MLTTGDAPVAFLTNQTDIANEQQTNGSIKEFKP
jgi:hypothetical protein